MESKRIERTEARPARGDVRATARPERTPINGERDILSVYGTRPGYHPVWVNEDQVPRFLKAGYTFVDTDGVTFGSYHIQQGNALGAKYTMNVGAGMIAYLMEIPQEWYDEDRKQEQADVTKTEASMKARARAEGLDHGDITFVKE
jgi:hypothetical protein